MPGRFGSLPGRAADTHANSETLLPAYVKQCYCFSVSRGADLIKLIQLPAVLAVQLSG